MNDYSVKDHIAYKMGFKAGQETQAARIAALEAAVTQCRTLSAMLKPQADRIAALEAALQEIEYLDRPQVRGLPRRVTIQQIALDALGEKQ